MIPRLWALSSIMARAAPRGRFSAARSNCRTRPGRVAIPVAMIGAGNFATRTLLPALACQPVPVELAAHCVGTGSLGGRGGEIFCRGPRDHGGGPGLVGSRDRGGVHYYASRYTCRAGAGRAGRRQARMGREAAGAHRGRRRGGHGGGARCRPYPAGGFQPAFSPLATRARQAMAKHGDRFESRRWLMRAGSTPTTGHSIREPVAAGSWAKPAISSIYSATWPGRRSSRCIARAGIRMAGRRKFRTHLRRRIVGLIDYRTTCRPPS